MKLACTLLMLLSRVVIRSRFKQSGAYPPNKAQRKEHLKFSSRKASLRDQSQSHPPEFGSIPASIPIVPELR